MENIFVDLDKDKIASSFDLDFYWTIRDRLSLNVLDVFTYLCKGRQI